MDDIIIREATISDIPTLLVFEQGVINAERPFDVTLKPGDIHYYDLPEMISASHIHLVVAESGNQIIGSGYARIEDVKIYLRHSKKAYLGFMYVLPEYRGKGVNQMIMKHLGAWASGRGINELRLDVYFENIGAIKAYEKAGFKKHMIEMRMEWEETNT